MQQDDSLQRAVDWFRSQPSYKERFAAAIRQSFDEVFDGQRTGRFRLEQLSKVEKTYIGTKVEIIVRDAFGLEKGHRLDYMVDEQEVDAKWSMRSGGWMIPEEAVGEICLCMTGDDNKSEFQVGLVRASNGRLKAGWNKDKKRYLNGDGLSSMMWLVHDGVLDENLLLHLDDNTRMAITSRELSGQGRINELFSRVQKRMIRREVVLTVARQDDGPKRVRDARRHLAKKGILILGHQESHPSIARDFGLQVPPKGSWVSCRVVRADEKGGLTSIIENVKWRLAGDNDSEEPGPANY
jgi:hypothetical protein